MEEIWKGVDGFEGFYQVSNLGRVKSLERQAKHNRFNVMMTLREKYLRPGISSSTYITVILSDGIKRKTFSLHRLLAIAFIPNPLNLPYINHIDGNKLNNNLSNLEWCTASENMKHAHRIGIKTIGAYAISVIKLTNSRKVVNIHSGKIYDSIIIASEAVGIDKSYLGHMLRGNTPNKTNLRFLECR